MRAFTNTRKGLAIIAGYFLISAIGGVLFHYSIKQVGGIDKIPGAFILLFGPIAALGQGHLIFVYLFATLVTLPTLIMATRAPRFWSSISLWVGIAVWLAVGFWML